MTIRPVTVLAGMRQVGWIDERDTFYRWPTSEEGMRPVFVADPDLETVAQFPTAPPSPDQVVRDSMRRPHGSASPELARSAAKDALWVAIARFNMSTGDGTKVAADAIESAVAALVASPEPTAQPSRCPLCGYQHGHAIGCQNNPVDIALSRPET